MPSDRPALLIDPGDLWRQVFDGRVRAAIEATRAHRRAHDKSPPQSGSGDRPVALYLEPVLASRRGHHANLAACYAGLLEELGYRTVTALAHATRLSIQQDWHPFFVVPPHTLAFKRIETAAELERVSAYFASEFGDLLARYDPRVCVFGTVRFSDVMAAAAALTQAPTGVPRKAILGVIEADRVPDCGDPGLVRSAFANAASILRDKRTPHRLVADSEPVRDFLLECGFDHRVVKLHPYVAASNIASGAHGRTRSNECVRIGYLGGTRPMKHPELIVDLLTAGWADTTLRWCVQLDLDYVERARGTQAVDRLRGLARRGAIELYPTAMDEAGYRALFCSLDLVVLPYSERYRQLGSGVLLEAIYADVVPIIPHDSNMHRLYSELGGAAPAFLELSSGAIHAAIAEALERLEQLKQAATHIRRRWRRHPASAEHWRTGLTTWLAGEDDGGADPPLPGRRGSGR